MRGNGLKVLTANNFIPQHAPVIECRGKYMLGGGTGGSKSGRSLPFVLVHRLSQEIELVVDGKTYGNDSRFCRRADVRSGENNAVVKYHLEKGSLHLYIVASKNNEKNQEILLPALEQKNGICPRWGDEHPGGDQDGHRKEVGEWNNGWEEERGGQH